MLCPSEGLQFQEEQIHAHALTHVFCVDVCGCRWSTAAVQSCNQATSASSGVQYTFFHCCDLLSLGTQPNIEAQLWRSFHYLASLNTFDTQLELEDNNG